MTDEEGSIAEELTQPEGPFSVLLHVSQTRIQVAWDSNLEGDDDTGSSITPVYTDEFDSNPQVTDSTRPATEAYDDGPHSVLFGLEQDTDDVTTSGEGVITQEEIAFFQVQLSDDRLFNNIVKYDRMVKGHSKTWRVSKPGSSLWYARVRSVDKLGNKSDWIQDSRTGDVPDTPVSPSIKFKRQTNSDALQAILTVPNIDFADEDISRYQFQLREVDYVRLTAHVAITDTVISIDDYRGIEVPMNPTTDEPDFTVYIESEELLVTSISGGHDLQWHVTRAQNSTVAAGHQIGKHVNYFGDEDKPVTTITFQEPASTYTRQVVKNNPQGTRYKARVRAIDAQNRKSEWSHYSPVIKASPGAYVPAGTDDGGDGDPADGDTSDPGTDTPTDSVGYPFERVFRLETDIVNGLESDTFSGLDGTITAARVELGTPSNAATVATGMMTIELNLNGIFFLAMTIDAGNTLSDMTWVDPPLHIGQTTGQTFIATDLITVNQTVMQDASGGLTVYLYAYLGGGT